MPLHIDTCSWNYGSWVGLVYDQPEARAVDYLAEYAKRYRMVEVDSWFYNITTLREVEEYAAAVDPGFTFMVKAPQDITLTHKRDGMEPNSAFLSPKLFGHFLERLAPICPLIGAIILEFEYPNRQKMPSQEAFLEKLVALVSRISRDIPIALEPRNGSYLDQTWFSFLEGNKISHVFSEMQYIPPIVELYARYSKLIGERVVLCLLG